MSAKEVEWDGLPVPKRYWAILAIAMGITVSVLDGTIANVALPSIAEDLQATPSMSIWILVFFGGYFRLSAGVYRRFVDI